MKVVINGENRALSQPTSLKQLILELNLENKRLAIEVNQSIVPRSEYTDFMVKDGDLIEIVQAIGGG